MTKAHNRAPHDSAFTTEEVWETMTPEQRLISTQLRSAVAAGPLGKYAVTEQTLRMVMTDAETGGKSFTIVHTGRGIDVGNPAKHNDPSRTYRAAMSASNNNLFLQLRRDSGGIHSADAYDMRSGMTDAVYTAMIEDARARGVTLPDSPDFAEENDDVHTWTMLTGEPLSETGFVQIRWVPSSVVDHSILDPDFDMPWARIRPATLIPIE